MTSRRSRPGADAAAPRSGTASLGVGDRRLVLAVAAGEADRLPRLLGDAAGKLGPATLLREADEVEPGGIVRRLVGEAAAAGLEIARAERDQFDHVVGVEAEPGCHRVGLVTISMSAPHYREGRRLRLAQATTS